MKGHRGKMGVKGQLVLKLVLKLILKLVWGFGGLKGQRGKMGV